jgi:hypothetical protein
LHAKANAKAKEVLSEVKESFEEALRESGVVGVGKSVTGGGERRYSIYLVYSTKVQILTQEGKRSRMPSLNMPSITWKSKAAASPLSPLLIIHFHGGGFIAQSSASHEVYLRDWARALDAPILSVDYDLAPEHPFPVAVCQVPAILCLN